MSVSTEHGSATAPGMDMRTHIRRLLALALPMVAARTAEFVIPIADAAMVGRHDTAALAALGMGWQPWIFLYVSGLGLLVAVSVLTSQAHGAGDARRQALVWRLGLRQAVVIGFVLMALCQFGAPALRALGIDPVLAEGAGRVLRAYGWGAPAGMVYLATSFFMSGAGRPLPDMLIMAGAVPVKLALNWLLVEGHGGFPALGAEGAALATAIMLWLVAAIFVLYVLARHREEQRALWPRRKGERDLDLRMLRLGTPVALSLALETGAYVALVLIAGHVGPATVGAYRVAMSTAMAPFMIGMALSSATSVRVGHAIGGGAQSDIHRAALSGFAVVAVVMILFAVPMALWSSPLARFFTTDVALIPNIAACLLVTAGYLLFEGSQVVLKLVLRSMGDVWMPFWISVASYWLVGTSAAALLGIVWRWDAPGITAGLGIAMVASALGNAWRYHRVARRSVARL